MFSIKPRIRSLLFGTAGSASADVLTVQGIANMTPLTVTAIGDPTDEAWDGEASSATVIALLKKIALNTEGT